MFVAQLFRKCQMQCSAFNRCWSKIDNEPKFDFDDQYDSGYWIRMRWFASFKSKERENKKQKSLLQLVNKDRKVPFESSVRVNEMSIKKKKRIETSKRNYFEKLFAFFCVASHCFDDTVKELSSNDGNAFLRVTKNKVFPVLFSGFVFVGLSIDVSKCATINVARHRQNQPKNQSFHFHFQPKLFFKF